MKLNKKKKNQIKSPLGICPPDAPPMESSLQIGELGLYTSSSNIDRNLNTYRHAQYEYLFITQLCEGGYVWSRMFSLGEMSEDKCSFLRRQFVFLLPGLLQQLLPHDGEDRTQQSAAKDLRGLIAWETVAKLRHVTVAQPPATGARK